MNTLPRKIGIAAAFLIASVVVPMVLTLTSPNQAYESLIGDPEPLLTYIILVIIGVPSMYKVLDLSTGWMRLTLALAFLLAVCGIFYLINFGPYAYAGIQRLGTFIGLFEMVWIGVIGACIILIPAAIVAWICEGFSGSNKQAA